MSVPIRFTDEQINAIMAAAQPLAPADRPAFLEEVAAGLQHCEIGDGAVGRVIREAQAKYWHPPRYGTRSIGHQ
jgi:hypothetical protein